MSSEQNAAMIQSLYDAFAKGDIPTILGRLADDVDWIVEGPSVIPYAGKHKGPGQVRQFFEALVTGETNQQLTMAAPIAQGDQVACLGRHRSSVKATGKSYEGAVAHFFTVRDGKVTRLVEVMDLVPIANSYVA